MLNNIDEKGFFTIYNAEEFFSGNEIYFEDFAKWVRDYILPEFNYVASTIVYKIYYNFDKEKNKIVLTSSNYKKVINSSSNMDFCFRRVFSCINPEHIYYENFRTSYCKNYYSAFKELCKTGDEINKKLHDYKSRGILKYKNFDKDGILDNENKELKKLYEDYLYGRVKLTGEQIHNMYDSETLDNIAWRIGVETLYNEIKKELDKCFK